MQGKPDCENPCMDTFESLREDFAGAFTAINDYALAQRRHAEAVTARDQVGWRVF